MSTPPRGPLAAGLGTVGVPAPPPDPPPPRDGSRCECGGPAFLAADVGPSLAPGACLPVASCAWGWFSSSSGAGGAAFTALGFIGGDGDEVITLAASGDASITSPPTRSAATAGDAFLREVLLGVTAATRGGGGS